MRNEQAKEEIAPRLRFLEKRKREKVKLQSERERKCYRCGERVDRDGGGGELDPIVMDCYTSLLFSINLSGRDGGLWCYPCVQRYIDAYAELRRWKGGKRWIGKRGRN